MYPSPRRAKHFRFLSNAVDRMLSLLFAQLPFRPFQEGKAFVPFLGRGLWFPSEGEPLS